MSVEKSLFPAYVDDISISSAISTMVTPCFSRERVQESHMAFTKYRRQKPPTRKSRYPQAIWPYTSCLVSCLIGDFMPQIVSQGNIQYINSYMHNQVQHNEWTTLHCITLRYHVCHTFHSSSQKLPCITGHHRHHHHQRKHASALVRARVQKHLVRNCYAKQIPLSLPLLLQIYRDFLNHDSNIEYRI